MSKKWKCAETFGEVGTYYLPDKLLTIRNGEVKVKTVYRKVTLK